MGILTNRINEGPGIWSKTDADKRVTGVQEFLKKLHEDDPVEKPRELTPEEKHVAASSTLRPAGFVVRERLKATKELEEQAKEQFKQVPLPPLSNKG